MERMSEYHGNRKHANSSSVPALNISLGNNSNNSSKSSGKGAAAATVMREQDQYMPIANVIRIMRRVLPGHAKISDDAKETVQECVSEYISFVTGEANDRCQREQRKTVTAEDVLWAMAKLGFDDYVEPLTLFLNRLRAASDANNNNAEIVIAPRVGAMHDQYGGGGMSSDVIHHHHHHQHQHQVGPYGQPGFDLAPYQGVFDAMGGGYFRDGFGEGGASGGGGGGGGGGPSSSLQNGAMASYDPFAHYK